MNIQDNTGLARWIVLKYGMNRQLEKLAEECCELGQAALKHSRDEGGQEALIGEIADVLFLINQIVEATETDEELKQRYKDIWQTMLERIVSE